MSKRTEKIGSVIKRAISTPINDLAKEFNAGISSINEITVSPDLQNAKIYISCFGGKINSLQFITILEQNKGKIKSALSRDAFLKYIPELKFFIDDSMDKMDKIQKVLDKINVDNKTLQDENQNDENDTDTDNNTVNETTEN